MNRHSSVVFLICTLAIAGCQPSQTQTIAQTQAAQAAFQNAVAAAQTQAGPPPTVGPSAAPPPTAAPSLIQPSPVPTDSPADQVEAYLRDVLYEQMQPLKPFANAEMGFIKYEADPDGNPGKLFMLFMRNEFTSDQTIGKVIFQAIVRTYSDPEASIRMPPTLKTYEMDMRDMQYTHSVSYRGDWANVMALADGRLSFDEFWSATASEWATPSYPTPAFWQP